MTNRLRSFLALPLILLSPALALADTITTFDVEGGAVVNVSGATIDSCANLQTCDFSGMFQVDVTTGTYESTGLAFTLPGLATFDSLEGSSPGSLNAGNSSGNSLNFRFTTEPTPDSLVGFTGGTIIGGGDGDDDYVIVPDRGTVTPVPEPSSLVPLAGGLGWLVFGLARRRFRKRSAIQVSQRLAHTPAQEAL
jgi:hypothetical protein